MGPPVEWPTSSVVVPAPVVVSVATVDVARDSPQTYAFAERSGQVQVWHLESEPSVLQ